jgi:phosphoheptose isomerase
LLAYFFWYFQKKVAASRRSQELLALIATTGDEVSITGSVKSAQTFWRGRLF